MATELYNEARAAFATKQLDWVNDDFVAVLLGEGYSFSPGDSLGSIPGGQFMTDPTPIAGRAVSPEGWFQCNDIIFLDIPDTGLQVVSAVVYNPTNPYLIYFSDELSGLPFESVGGTYALRTTNAEGALFRL